MSSISLQQVFFLKKINIILFKIRTNFLQKLWHWVRCNKTILLLFRSNLFLLPTLTTHAWLFPDELTHWRDSALTDCLQLSCVCVAFPIYKERSFTLAQPLWSKQHSAFPPSSPSHLHTVSRYRTVSLFIEIHFFSYYVGGIPSVAIVAAAFTGLICFLKSAVGAKTAFWLFIWEILLCKLAPS